MRDAMVQLLTPEGTRVEHPDYAYQGGFDDLRRSLKQMWLGRRFDAEATALQRHGELGLWPPQLGQEAAQVGVAHAIGPADHVFPTYREHTVALTLGLPMEPALALFRGSNPGHFSEPKRFMPYSIVIGAHTLHAVGYAMGIQLDGLVGNGDGTDEAVVAFHGDGASAQGDVNEAYVFAASYNAPVVFFCQNNQWAISEPATVQSRIPLYQRARGFGFPGVQVDGNDVLAVEAVSRWALERARAGEGPTFIEAYTYRMGAHTTADDPTKYRHRDEEERWRGRDPINRLMTYLRAEDQLDDSFLAELEAEADELGELTRASIRRITDVTLAELFATTYAEPTVALSAQAQQQAEYAASFEEA
ncbi:thiamine pyrophosphate-dependent dehydrogenase E1 component subunit alpha [Tessaracoccus sp. OH4464_COT-324]|uniref:thiamine pyrophosphate-dependent dehydrogenase E1 component subunit alpha n=1 Tax=Tessaracoccus sp. OH4464_COT-324 TaxID=2491059 RepID=UPI000F63FDE4|nr:thiamine pyrophosphate-dependent dehydrogenase E1 component subunit alpha [Tessaracoccus sp. OH4464_COT-324]RRD45723.1 thiamine pyrophosphate-dependent dehydrogenase E1 component subunit alpha [Tessaracoccus sp. OH4464_COT-324]